MFKIIAHRGASADAPDNTQLAFELAIEQAADLIETDLRMSADGVLLLEHDSSISGLEVQFHPFAKLKELKPDLLSLAQAVRQFGDKVPFCFEFKQAGLEPAVIYLLHDLLSKPFWQKTEFTSFNFSSAVASVKLLGQLGQSNQVGWLTRQWDKDAIELCLEHGLTQICPMAKAVLDQPQWLDFAKEKGLNVRVWLVEAAAWVKDLNALGVYGGTVNFPAAARVFLEA